MKKLLIAALVLWASLAHAAATPFVQSAGTSGTLQQADGIGGFSAYAGHSCGSATFTNSISADGSLGCAGVSWSDISGKPATISGYGITDALLYSTSSYSDPAWITALGWSKLTGVPSLVNSFNGRSGAVTLSSGDVTTALGFTPLATTGSGASLTGITAAQVGAEAALGNPATSGYVLSSTTAGVRSWVAQSGGGSMVYPGAGVANSTGSAWAASYGVGTGAHDLVQLGATPGIANSSTYLRGDGTWATPSVGSGTDTDAFLNFLWVNVPAGAVGTPYIYYEPLQGGHSTTTSNNEDGIIMPISCTAKNLYIMTNGGQTSTGALNVCLYYNGAVTSLCATVPAGGATGTYSDTTNTVAITQGGTVQLQLANSGTASSTTTSSVSMACQ